ncbi:unnamed protein product [Cuscuta epithymum]|uniref:Uncharacterized protein n=1 Tax=Cuscuta epithymum TaxID=186058 RepID=A0AAV0EZM6_9ASTE|nr:unnamed protein product [Cuscuta epithymum]
MHRHDSPFGFFVFPFLIFFSFLLPSPSFFSSHISSSLLFFSSFLVSFILFFFRILHSNSFHKRHQPSPPISSSLVTTDQPSPPRCRSSSKCRSPPKPQLV